MLNQNVDPVDSSAHLGLLKKVGIKLGFYKTKQVQQQTEEVNHLKFQIQMLCRFRTKIIRLELERAKLIEDDDMFKYRTHKIKTQCAKMKQELKISSSVLEKIKVRADI